MNKKEIITAMIIVLLVLSAIVIIWEVVENLVETEQNQNNNLEINVTNGSLKEIPNQEDYNITIYNISGGCNSVIGYLFSFSFDENVSIQSRKYFTYGLLKARWEYQRELGFHNKSKPSEKYPLLYTSLSCTIEPNYKNYTKKYWKLEHFTGEDDCVEERPEFCYIKYEEGKNK